MFRYRSRGTSRVCIAGTTAHSSILSFVAAFRDGPNMNRSYGYVLWTAANNKWCQVAAYLDLPYSVYRVWLEGVACADQRLLCSPAHAKLFWTHRCLLSCWKKLCVYAKHDLEPQNRQGV